MGIHAIDIVQPPGICIAPIADMDAHQAIVTATLAAKSGAETARMARSEPRSETVGSALCRFIAPTTAATWFSACRTRHGGTIRERC
jgi:hypothetical protein